MPGVANFAKLKEHPFLIALIKMVSSLFCRCSIIRMNRGRLQLWYYYLRYIHKVSSGNLSNKKLVFYYVRK